MTPQPTGQRREPDGPAAGLAPDPWSGRTFLRLSILGAWTMYLAGEAARLLLFGSRELPALLCRHLVTALAGAALTFARHAVLKRLDTASLGHRLGAAVIACAPFAALLALLDYEIVFVVAVKAIWTRQELATYSLIGTVGATVGEYYFLLVAWAILYTTVSGATQFHHARQAVMAAEAQARASQLQALRYQLNPHLMFNALNSISALVMKNEPESADAAIVALSRFLRSTLDLDATSDLRLEEELRLQHLYLALEQIRFGDRLSVMVSIPEEALEASVPALILQPLVENAVHHGVSRSSRPVLLSIAAAVDGQDLLVWVRDDARGAARETTSGLGLQNVKARLAMRFGHRAACVCGARPDGGFEVSLRLPYRRHSASGGA